MKKGFYKHKRCMDLFIEVLAVSYVGPKYTKFKIRYWVQCKYGKPYMPFHAHNNIKVLVDDLDDWLPYEILTWV